MIIARSPLRISLGGGGTDLPSYYTEHGGFVISAAIDKYVYITLHEVFQQELIIKYSKMEIVTSVDQVVHPIIREALRLAGVGAAPWLEITSMSDIPAGMTNFKAVVEFFRQGNVVASPTGTAMWRLLKRASCPIPRHATRC